MDEREKLARIQLIQTRHIGPMTFSLLIQRYGSAHAALAAIPDLAAREGTQTIDRKPCRCQGQTCCE
ncbi:hypothetical protein [Candidatus Ponderosibacter sp. Uisw_141_02]|uniref:hypothetical protein n=1 Tax=Candidatus Ponderosibacter sp. Uisw_141_02 TaxID=3231000 RepID=UPI003D49C7B6